MYENKMKVLNDKKKHTTNHSWANLYHFTTFRKNRGMSEESDFSCISPSNPLSSLVLGQVVSSSREVGQP